LKLCSRSHFQGDMEILFRGLKKWFNKLETCVHQVKTKTDAVFSTKTKTEIKVTKPRSNYMLNVVLHFTLLLTGGYPHPSTPIRIINHITRKDNYKGTR
jgi:hypothetical protein